MNYKTVIVSNLSEVEGEIIGAQVLNFADDWMPQDANLLTAAELTERVEGIKALNGKLLVAVLMPENTNFPSEWEARGSYE